MIKYRTIPSAEAPCKAGDSDKLILEVPKHPKTVCFAEITMGFLAYEASASLPYPCQKFTNVAFLGHALACGPCVVGDVARVHEAAAQGWPYATKYVWRPGPPRSHIHRTISEICYGRLVFNLQITVRLLHAAATLYENAPRGGTYRLGVWGELCKCRANGYCNEAADIREDTLVALLL
ncbi:hypothetical protein BC629DRAFT_1434864 [Irpex lacteus]|nr:hypothetical protein BC629DRAFT_1434864 [Irpex lacteus]